MKKVLVILALALPMVALAHGYSWENAGSGWKLPYNKVAGGNADGRTLYVCKAGYRGEVHPGYLMNGTCHIVVGNRGYTINNFQVLTGNGFRWHEGKHGHIPGHAINGGYARGKQLYVCKARYKMGTYTGELNGSDCYFAYNGDRKHDGHYRVLIRS